MPDLFCRVPGGFLRALLLPVCLLLAWPGSVPAQNPALSVSDPEPAASTPAPLHLRQALAWTLLHNPELAAYSEEVRAREAEMLQAGFRPNPFLSLEAENVLGSGTYSGTEAAELTLFLQQPIELGGKRPKRRALAAAEIEVARSEYLLARTEVLTGTTNGFINLLAARDRLALAAELTALAAQMLENVEERIAAGKTASSERGRALIHLQEMKITRLKAKRELTAARRLLAARIGLPAVDFGPAAGKLDRLPSPPALAELEGLIEQSPLIARKMEEIELRKRTVALERAERLPDLEVGLGARYDRESEDTGLLFGITVPLPLFNQNQGAVAAARSRLAGAEARKENAMLEAKAALAEAWEAMAGSHEEAGILRDEVLPAARQSLEAAEYGYQAGKFGLLEVLDSQRTLVEARDRYLQALAAFHRAAAEMGRLLGSGLPDHPLAELPANHSGSHRPDDSANQLNK